MIPPSLLNASFLFTLVPIWEQEPVSPAPCPAPATDGHDPTPSESGTTPSGQPAGDADGINDQVALRMVLKGYKLAVIPDWVAEANPGYDHWVEGRSDDDAERQRQDQRARSAIRPASPQGPSGPEQPDTAPSAPSDGGE
jgi:hypothetical protein